MGDWTRHPFKHRDEPLVTIPIVFAELSAFEQNECVYPH